MTDTILCIDIGTTSLKAALIGADGSFQAFSRQSFNKSKSSTEKDARASADWLPALKKAVQEMQSGKLSVCALCISGNGPTMVAETGETLLWNAPISKKIATSSLFIPRITAFRDLYPKVWSRSLYVFSGPEYVIWQLTGTAITILPEERYRTAYWTDSELSKFDIESSKLPPYVFPATEAGKILPVAAEKIGLSKGIPVFCGGPDFIVALIGTGTLYNGTLCDRAGSSEGINFCTDVQLSGKNIRPLPSVIQGLWNSAALIPESGIRFTRFRYEYEKKRGIPVSYSALVDKLISDRTSEGYHLLCDIAYKVKDAFDTLKNAAEEKHIPWPKSMAMTGGQALNEKWIQLKSNIIGTDIIVAECAHAELTGDAILACVGLGEYDTIRNAADHLIVAKKTYSPQ